MKKTLLIIRQELIITFSRPSYLVVAIGIPLLAVLILGGVKLIQSRSGEKDTTSINPSEEWQMEIEGYIDKILPFINQAAPVGTANPQIDSNTITLRVVTIGKPLGSMNLFYDGACCDALQKTLEATCAPISR